MRDTSARPQPDLSEVERGRLAALRRDDLARDLRGDVRVAVAVAAHPRREDDGRRAERERRAALLGDDGVEPAHVARHGVPERRLEHREPAARLFLRRRLRAPQLVRAPHARDLTPQRALELRALVSAFDARERFRGIDRVALGEQLGHAAVLRGVRAAASIGRITVPVSLRASATVQRTRSHDTARRAMCYAHVQTNDVCCAHH